MGHESTIPFFNMSDPEGYMTAGIAIPFFNPNTMGKLFLPIACVEGMGASELILRKIHPLLQNQQIYACKYDGGMNRILRLDINSAQRKAEVDLIANHLDQGAAFICAQLRNVFGGGYAPSPLAIVDTLEDNLRHFKRYSPDHNIFSIHPDSNSREIIEELKAHGCYEELNI